jgi:hypothetical protein
MHSLTRSTSIFSQRKNKKRVKIHTPCKAKNKQTDDNSKHEELAGIRIKAAN